VNLSQAPEFISYIPHINDEGYYNDMHCKGRGTGKRLSVCVALGFGRYQKKNNRTQTNGVSDLLTREQASIST